MNKTDFINALSDKLAISKAESKKVLDAFEEIIVDNAKSRTKISLMGFLTIEAVHKPESTVRNPKTGEQMQSAAKWVLKVKPSSVLQKRINE